MVNYAFIVVFAFILVMVMFVCILLINFLCSFNNEAPGRGHDPEASESSSRLLDVIEMVRLGVQNERWCDPINYPA